MKFKVSFTTDGQELKEEWVMEFVESLHQHYKDGSITGTIVHDLEIERLDVPLYDALRELGSEDINEALDKGWEPDPVEKAMEKVFCSFEERDFAEMYVETTKAELKGNVPRSVACCQYVYESAASEFLIDLKLRDFEQRYLCAYCIVSGKECLKGIVKKQKDETEIEAIKQAIDEDKPFYWFYVKEELVSLLENLGTFKMLGALDPNSDEYVEAASKALSACRSYTIEALGMYPRCIRWEGNRKWVRNE